MIPATEIHTVEIEAETHRYLDRLGKKKTAEDSKEGKAK